MEHLKAYILALKNMNTDFTIRIAQQSDALELMSLFQETVLHINKRDYSEAEVADWASCGNDISHIKEMIRTTVTDCRLFIHYPPRIFAFYVCS